MIGSTCSMAFHSEFGINIPYRLRNASGDDGGVEKEEGLVSEALAKNMRQLRGERAIGVLRQEMAARGIQIGTSTLHRADKGEMGIRVESLAKIGEFFSVGADQLLQFDLGAQAWPLTGAVSRAEWDLLPPGLREDILAQVKHMVDRHRPPSSGESSGSSSVGGPRRAA